MYGKRMKTRTKNNCAKRRRTPQFQQIEARRPLAASIGLEDGALTLDGTEQADVIAVDRVEESAA